VARRRCLPASDQHGAVLVVVILLMALMLSLGAVGTRTAQIEMRIASNDLQSKQALETAEAGLSHAFALIKRDDTSHLNGAANGFDDELSGGGVGGALAALGPIETLADGTAYRFGQMSGQTGSDGYLVHAVDNQDETSGADDPTTDRDNTVHLVSRGRVGNAERVLEAVVRRDGTYPCALCGALGQPLIPVDVTLTGQISTDSFDSRNGPYNAGSAGSRGSVLSDGDMTLIGGAGVQPVDVKGDVTASRSVVKQQSVTVSGATTQFAPAVDFPAVLPCGPPFPPNDGITGGAYDRSTGVLSNVGPNDIIDLAPHDYCFSAIAMTGNSALRVSGPTHVNLTRPSVVRSIINTTGAAANLRLSSSVVTPLPVLPSTIPGIAVVGLGGSVTMAIDAPGALVSLTGVSDFYGQIVGGVLTNVGIDRLHYDEALDDPGVYRLGWRELRNDPAL
jgi:hypothetical protein